MQHIAQVELSSSVLLQTLGKLKSLQGTELSVVVMIIVNKIPLEGAS